MLQSFYVPLYHSRKCTTFKAKNVPKMYHSDDVRDVICVAEAFSFSFALLPTRLCRLAVFLVKPTFSLFALMGLLELGDLRRQVMEYVCRLS